MILPSIALTVLAATATGARASLDVRVTGGSRPVDVVLRRSGDGGEPRDVASRRLPPAASTASFRDLDPGTYLVIASGADPLARRAVRVRLEKGRRERVSLPIEPRRVRGTILRAGQPLANVRLQFRNDELGWISAWQADAQGNFVSELWQPGSYTVFVTRGVLHNTSTVRHVNIDGGALTLSVPTRQVQGRVIDVASGRGVPDAYVVLRTQMVSSATTVGQRTDDQGAFLFDAVSAGRQRLTVTDDDFLIPEPVELTLGEDDPPADVTLRLDSGYPRTLRVFDHHGQPVHGAEVMALDGVRVRSASKTGADGRDVIAVPATPVVLYVIAPDGAFAVIDRGDVDRVDLRAPQSSLRVMTRSTIGGMLPPMSFIMSIDGRVIPPAVAQRMAQLQGLSLTTDGAGELHLQHIPAGEYQFWPYQGEAEAETILSAPYNAPIAVTVKSGENAVAVDFRPALSAR